MALTSWTDPFLSDPFGEMRRIQKDMDRLFNKFGEGATTEVSSSFWRPAVDIRETNEFFIIHADLPGMRREDIKIDLLDNVLTISGERNLEKKEENEKYHKLERNYGKYSRSVNIPKGVAQHQIKANFRDGVLEVLVPKAQQQQPEPLKINIA